MRFYNKRELQERRITLRAAATPQEVILWSRLRRNQTGYRFRRQHGIGWYIVDFYCPEKRLAIEIDGSQHKANKEYDAERTRYLQAHGIAVIRFWDNEINKDIERVVERIMTTVHNSTSPPC